MANLACATLVVGFPAGESASDERYDFPAKLLQLAFEKTEEEGEVEIRRVGLGQVQARMIWMLEHNYTFDVVSLPVSSEAHARLRPISVPIRLGLLGWRVLIIRQQDLAGFAKVNTLVELSQFTPGYGESWGDLNVLEHNLGPAVLSSNYDSLFEMLHAGRFDYLHRGFHEPWDELNAPNRQSLDLVVEPRLMLHYPNASIFYVAKNNLSLAERIEKGLRRALSDGSFHHLLAKQYGGLRDYLQGCEKRVFHLENPFLPEDFPLDDETLWITPFDLYAHVNCEG
ncbi:MAG: hypothetical protein RIK85_13020 [Marinobacter sp.]